ncbi:MAG: alpha/beta hydrolase [Lachnospiraceae bacterium]|nr:alpha/beta hydrolase [Lachnospiraceae bacterium]
MAGKKVSDKKTKVPQRVKMMRKMWAMGDAQRDAGLQEPEDVEKFRNLSYGPFGEANLLDVYRPVKQAGKMLPVIVNVHGGGYFYGDKELYRFYAMHLAQFGFAVVNFNYRLAPEHKFPAPLEDTMAVFTWIAEHAKEYGLDTKHVFMVGDSAGAQLTSQFACIWTNKAYAKLFSFTIPNSIRLCGVSLACGMYELRPGLTAPNNDMMMDYLGDMSMAQDDRTEILSNITKDFPPAYVFSAVYDSLKAECRPFAAFLRKKGIMVSSRIYGRKEDTGAVHVFHVNLKLPIGQRCNRDQIAFFRKLIKQG